MGDKPVKAALVRFGGFELDRRSCELLRAGRRVHLTPQAFQLLDLLVDRTATVVSRDDIRRNMWDADTFVDFDAALNVCVSQIRFALGDKATAPRFIETLPRRGYRFVAPVEIVTFDAAAASPETATALLASTTVAPVPALAPAGSRLGLIGALLLSVVIAALAIIPPRGVRRAPGMEFAGARSLEAVQKFERGRSGLADAAPSELLDRVQYLTTAVTLEPQFAEAYAALADAHLLIAAYRARDAQLSYAAAKASGAKAVHLSPELGDAHAVYATALLLFDWDVPSAARHFRRALALSPQSQRVQHWYARYLTAVGRNRDAVRHARQALALSPSSPSAQTYAGVAQFYAGNLTAAKEHCGRALALMPEFQPAQLCLDASSEPSRLAPALPEAYLQPILTAAGSGDRLRALDGLQTATNRHSDTIPFAAVQPALRVLAHEPRFQALVERTGIPLHAHPAR